MTHTLDCLKVVSYNCRGWKSGSNYVQSLLQSCDIYLIQEHWLLRENLDSLIISDFFLIFFFYGNRFMQQQRSQEDSYIHKRLIANINLGPCTKTKTLHSRYI